MSVLVAKLNFDKPNMRVNFSCNFKDDVHLVADNQDIHVIGYIEPVVNDNKNSKVSNTEKKELTDTQIINMPIKENINIKVDKKHLKDLNDFQNIEKVNVPKLTVPSVKDHMNKISTNKISNKGYRK